MTEEERLPLREVLRTLRLWWPLVLVSMVVCAVTVTLVAPKESDLLASSTIEYVNDPYIYSLSGVSTVSPPERIREVAAVLTSKRFLRVVGAGVQQITATPGVAPYETQLLVTVRATTRASLRQGLDQAISEVRRLNDKRVAEELTGVRVSTETELRGTRTNTRPRARLQAKLQQIALAGQHQPQGLAPSETVVKRVSKRSTLTALGAILGLILGLGLVLGIEVLRGRVWSDRDLVRRKVPVLGELAADGTRSDPVTLRRLGTRLRRLLDAQPGLRAIIVLHDPAPEADHAVLAVADALAATGLDVAVATVDAPADGDSLARELAAGPGRHDPAPEGAERSAVSVATDAPPKGRRVLVPVGDRAELGDVDVDLSLTLLQEHHDVVLVDGLMSDGKLPPIGTAVGAAIHVVRLGQTRRVDLANVRRALSEMDLPLVGALVVTTP